MAETTPPWVVLKRLRSVLGDTQEQLARRMGTAVRTIARWESESEPVGSLPLEVVMQLRHLAIEAEDDIVMQYFDDRAYAICDSPDATEWSRLVFSYLPRSQKEIEAVGELLRRMREEDPAIRPVLKQLGGLLQARAVQEEQERQREAERRAARGPELKLTPEELKEQISKYLATAKRQRETEAKEGKR